MTTMQTLYFNEKVILQEIYDFLVLLDKKSITKGIDESILNKIINFRNKLHEANKNLELFLRDKSKREIDFSKLILLKEKMSDLYVLFDQEVDSFQGKLNVEKNRFAINIQNFKSKLSVKYEECLMNFKAEFVQLPHLRPKNIYRNIFHLSSGILVTLSVNFIFTKEAYTNIAIVFFILAWTLDLGRKKYLTLQKFSLFIFKSVHHPHEKHKINSATWYTTSLLILALFFDLQSINCALLVLAISDPSAALIGRKYGKIKLINGRTLEGSSTFFLTASICIIAIFMAYNPEKHFIELIIPSLLTALLPTIAELTSRRIDDNLTIPLIAAIGMALSSFFFL